MKRLIIAVMTLCIVLLIAAGVCIAANDTINACITKSTGQIRIVSLPTQCKANEAPLSWNIAGPAGPAGADGAPGPAGADGAPGPAGNVDMSKFYSVECQNASVCDCTDLADLAIACSLDCNVSGFVVKETLPVGSQCQGMCYNPTTVEWMNDRITTTCLKGVCHNSGDCGMNRYCEKAVADCGGEGTCKDRPSVCPDLYDPVCGCNGVTYDNACKAAMYWQSVAHPGGCT